MGGGQYSMQKFVKACTSVMNSIRVIWIKVMHCIHILKILLLRDQSILGLKYAQDSSVDLDAGNNIPQ